MRRGKKPKNPTLLGQHLHPPFVPPARGCVAVAAGAEASCPALVEATGPEEGIRLSILLE